VPVSVSLCSDDGRLFEALDVLLNHTVSNTVKLPPTDCLSLPSLQ